MGKRKYTGRIREGWKGKMDAQCSMGFAPVHEASSAQEMLFGLPYSQCHPQGGWRMGLPSPRGPGAEISYSNNPCSELMPVASCPPWWKYFLGSGKDIRMRRGDSLVVSTRPFTAKSSNFIVSSEHLLIRIARKQKDEWLWSYLCLSYLLLFISRVWVIINMSLVSGSSSLWMGLCQAASYQRIQGLGLCWQGVSKL